jgi:hypothetical protein
VTAVVEALGPVCLVIALGWAMRRHGFPGDAFWTPAEGLAYFLLLPALIAGGLARVPFAALTVAPMAAALAAALIAGALVMTALRKRIAPDGPAFTSLFQGSIRLNGFIGLAIALALWGEAGLALSAVAIGVFVPIVNVMCVAVLGRHTGGGADWRALGLSLARNPLIIACLLGVTLNALGGPPPVLGGALDIFGQAALPVGLLCVGAGLSFSGLGRAGRGLAVVVLVKLAILPLVAALACALLGVEGVSARVAILFAALPTATSSYILSRRMGGDSELMAQVVAATHLAALISLPAVLLWLA